MAIDRAKGRGPIPAGSNQQIQYNNNGVLGASSNMTFDGSRLDVTGEMRASTGILFGTDTAAVNRLDDYEEGTWTPTLPNGGTIVTIDYATYVKIGKVVKASTYISNFSGIPNDNNMFRVGGFPFGSDNYAPGFQSYSGLTDWSDVWGPQMDQLGSTQCYFHFKTTNANNFMRNSDVVAKGTSQMMFTLIYEST